MTVYFPNWSPEMAAAQEAEQAAAASHGAESSPRRTRRRHDAMQDTVVHKDKDYDRLGHHFVDFIEQGDLGGMTPLHYAAFEGHCDIINLLCDAGADILAKDNLGQTALHWAVQGCKHDAVSLLMEWEKGAQAICMVSCLWIMITISTYIDSSTKVNLILIMIISIL